MSVTLLLVVAGLLVLVGLAGVVLPALPGAPLVFAGLLLAAWAEGFQKVGMVPLVILAVLTAVAFAADLVAATLGAKRVGASAQAVAGAAIGTLAGLFMGFVGLLFAPLVGAAAGELMARRNVLRAAHVGVATWVALLVAAIAKVAIAFTMLGVFLAAYLIP